MSIIINNYELENNKINRSIKIMLISDIHNNTNVLNEIINVVENIKPDYICIPGDLIDSVNDNPNNILIWLKKLTKTVEKILISIGNHDISEYKDNYCSYNDNKLFFDKINKIKGCILLNKIFCQKKEEKINITFNAINIPLDWYNNNLESEIKFKNYLKKLNIKKDNNFNVLLCHNPRWFIEKNKIISKNKYNFINNVDLLFCGHNHAGLVPRFLRNLIPYKTGIISPYKKLFNKYAYGYWNNENTSLIISGGITKLSTSAKSLHKFNFLFCSEIDIIDIKKGYNNKLKFLNYKKFKNK